MSQQFDVIVIGAGVVGLTAALAMAEREYSVAVIDSGDLKADSTRADPRVYAINHASKSLLQKLGAWQNLDSTRVSPYSKMHVWDAMNGALIDFDSRDIAAQNLGAIIEESVLKQALLQRVYLRSNINLFPQSTVDDLCNQEQSIRVSSQERTWDGRLLMVADGANSPTRKKLKVELTSWPYHQQAVIVTVTTEKPHQNTAYQVFNPDGPLAFLPLVHPNQCSIVWSTNAARAQVLMGLSDDEFNAELTRAFAAKLGQVHVISTRHQFPLLMRHVKQYIGDHWMILGDAAHTIHPLAGLGLNVGLADVSTWLNCLDAVKSSSFTPKMLGAYQRERKHAVWQIILLMEGFKRAFSPTFAPINVLRGLGLRACNKITPLKRLFIQHAAGQ